MDRGVNNLVWTTSHQFVGQKLMISFFLLPQKEKNTVFNQGQKEWIRIVKVLQVQEEFAHQNQSEYVLSVSVFSTGECNLKYLMAYLNI